MVSGSLKMAIDGVRSGGSATRGREKDRRQIHLLKRRKQMRDKAEDLRFEIELKKAMEL